jgi:hypothetical protein
MDLNIVPRDTILEAIRIQFSIFRKIGIEEQRLYNLESDSDIQSTMIIWYD